MEKRLVSRLCRLHLIGISSDSVVASLYTSLNNLTKRSHICLCHWLIKPSLASHWVVGFICFPARAKRGKLSQPRCTLRPRASQYFLLLKQHCSPPFGIVVSQLEANQITRRIFSHETLSMPCIHSNCKYFLHIDDKG